MNNEQSTERQQQAKDRKREVTYTNYNIRAPYVSVIQDDRRPVVMKTKDAIADAESQGLDLVQIAYDKQNHRAVCKIIDYGKFKYEQSKRAKDAKRQARANAVDIKQVQFSVTTEDADKKRLIAQAKGFLAEGDKVRLVIRFRNRRESQKLDYAKEVMKGLLSSFDGIAALDSAPAVSGRELSCVLRGQKKGQQ